MTQTNTDNRTEERKNRFSGQSYMLTKEVHESTYWGRQTNTKIEVDETRLTSVG